MIGGISQGLGEYNSFTTGGWLGGYIEVTLEDLDPAKVLSALFMRGRVNASHDRHAFDLEHLRKTVSDC